MSTATKARADRRTVAQEPLYCPDGQRVMAGDVYVRARHGLTPTELGMTRVLFVAYGVMTDAWAWPNGMAFATPDEWRASNMGRPDGAMGIKTGNPFPRRLLRRRGNP